MRKIIVSENVSLNGYFAGPNREIDWFNRKEEMAKYAINLLGIVDTILLGRVTYKLMASYWPSASSPTEDPILIDKM